jgi:hypothetical protein
MRVTNNRATNAWFNYRINGVAKKVFVGAYKTINLRELRDVNDVSSKRAIANFSSRRAPSNSYLTGFTDTNSVVVPTGRIETVDKQGSRSGNVNFTTDHQTKGRWEIEW